MVSGAVRGYAWAAATAALYAAFVLGSRSGLTASSLGPADMTAIRFAIAALVVSPVFVRHRLAGLQPWQAAVLALTGGGGFAFSAYAGFALAPASHGSALIHGALPLTTLVVLAMYLRRPPGLARLAAAAVTAGGIAFMVSDSVTALSAEQLRGDACLLLASLLWSTYGVCLFRWSVPPLPAAAMVAMLSALVYLPVYLFLGAGNLQAVPWDELMAQAILQGVLVGVVSNLCFAKAVSLLGSARTAAALASVPVVVAVGALFFLGEQPTGLAWTGISLVVLGVIFHTCVREARPARSPAFRAPGARG